MTIDYDSFEFSPIGGILEVKVALHEVSNASVARTAHKDIDGRCSKPIRSLGVKPVVRPVMLCADVQHSLIIE